MVKLIFNGMILSVQPRIRMIRSFDERSHNYLGYSLLIKGVIDSLDQEFTDRSELDKSEKIFSVGIGKAAHQKHKFCAGDEVSGECVPVADEWLEPVEFYKVSKLKKAGHNTTRPHTSPPWEDVPPDLVIYRERGHRRLAARTYDTKCTTCLWGCRMPVEIIVDNWNPGKRKYRFETFCYGPISCKLYKAGPIRKVEGRNGMLYEEENWVDEESTGHREMDD